MRPVLHGDVVAAARVLHDLPNSDRGGVLQRLLLRAGWADRHRKRTGRVHPVWGDGSLMTAALAEGPPPEPRLDDLDYCACMAMVFDALVAGSGNAGRVSRGRS